MSLRLSAKLLVVAAIAVVSAFVLAGSASAYTCTPVEVNGTTPELGPAVACTTVTDVVSGSALTISTTETAVNSTGAGNTLGHTDGVASYSIAYKTGDNTGTGDGWKETIDQTPFTSTLALHGHVRTIGDDTNPTHVHYTTSGAAVTSVGTANGAESTNTAIGGSEPVGEGAIVNVPNPVGTESPEPSGTVFETAAVESGLGNFIITPTVTVEIPANTYAGTYTATTEVDLTAGP